jgi:lipid-A-disaccharide synthase
MLPLMNNQFYSLKDFKSIGLIEVILSLRKYIYMINQLSRLIVQNKYEAIITIDSPDFNYPLAKNIRKKGYKGKIIQVVAPTVWAWRKYRSKKFSKIFDKMLTLFPFENKYFQRYNLSTTCIGHPIFYIKNYPRLNNQNKYIAFLPGSRLGEVKSLIRYFELASEYLDKVSSPLQIFIPTLPHLYDVIISLTKNWNNKPLITIEEEINNKLFSQTSLALVCSGTAALEISKRKIPQLIIYKLNYITECIFNLLVNVKYANIINIMANKMIIPEIINSKLNSMGFLEHFKKLVHNYENVNDKQIENSKKYLNKLEFNKSPGSIAANEIKNLFF